jgi:hypothetical protein
MKMLEPVVKTITVSCTAETAFRIFTQDFSLWWPKDKHSVSAMGGSPAKAVTLVPEVGGAITETGPDGTIHNWGSVRVYEPSTKLSLLWHIGKPAEQATLVDVDFETVDQGTKVTLKHYDWEALGDDAAAMREGYNNGWGNVFEVCFAKACEI